MLAKSAKRVKAIGVFVTLGLLFVCRHPFLLGQACSPKDGETSLAAVAEEVKAQFGGVRFHREEELEEQFIAHSLAPSDSLAPHFYQLQKPRYELSDGKVIDNVANGIPTMFVATTANEHKVFKLYGFGSPEQEFNHLVAEAPAQKVRNLAGAMSRGLLCAQVVYGFSPQWWVADPANAKLKAANHFFAEGHHDGLLKAQKWWNSMKQYESLMRINVSKEGAQGFAIDLPVFWAPVEGPSILQINIYHISVSEAGTCHMNPQPARSLQ